MPWGTATSAPLSNARCRALLASTSVGVVALSMRALPMAFPLAFALLDNDVIVRTATSGSLLPQMSDQIVTLMAFDYPVASNQPMWAVSVTGRAHVVGDRALLSHHRVQALPVCSPSDTYVRIPLDIVVGEERLH